MVKATELTFILPNLAPILQQKLNNELLSSTLKKLINKGMFQASNVSLERSLFNHFSSHAIDPVDLPMASLRHPQSISLCADPCYLHADRDQLVLLTDKLSITQQESDTIINVIQPLLVEFGAVLTADDSEHWTMLLQSVPDLTFAALPDVLGKSINGHLLTGSDQKDWLRLWNEIQMLLFDLPINQQRIAAGKFPINSLWLWGKGEFVPENNCWISTMGQNPLLAQLANRANVEHSVNIVDPKELAIGRHLIVCDSLNLESDWQQKLQQIEQQLLQPVWQLLKRCKISSLTLQVPEHGEYSIKPIDIWKFW